MPKPSQRKCHGLLDTMNSNCGAQGNIEQGKWEFLIWQLVYAKTTVNLMLFISQFQ